VYHSRVWFHSGQHCAADEFLMLWSCRSLPPQWERVTMSIFPAVVDDMQWKILMLPSMGQRCIFNEYFIAVFCKSLGNAILGTLRQPDFKVPLQDKLGQHIWWSYFDFDSLFYYAGTYVIPFCLVEWANGVKCIWCRKTTYSTCHHLAVLYI